MQVRRNNESRDLRELAVSINEISAADANNAGKVSSSYPSRPHGSIHHRCVCYCITVSITLMQIMNLTEI